MGEFKRLCSLTCTTSPGVLDAREGGQAAASVVALPEE
jgi:hypothetical protein